MDKLEGQVSCMKTTYGLTRKQVKSLVNTMLDLDVDCE